MNKFLFKSSDADLQKMLSILETIQKNVLYSTHQMDFIRRKVIELDTNKTLQDQAHDYFEKKSVDEQNLDTWSKEDLD